MSVYQPCTFAINSLGDFNVTILPEDVINPITGGSGVTTVKFDLLNATTPATVEYVSTSTTYSFEGVTGTASGLGVDATFNVVVGVNSVTVTLADIGSGYADSETITISGADVGGATPDNDIVITITEVSDPDGEVVAFTTGSPTPAWPQALTCATFVMPGAISQFVQVNASSPNEGVYLSITGTDGDTYIQPVTIEG